MPSYLLLEDGGKITLEDSSGFILLELQDVTPIPPGGGSRHGRHQPRRRFKYADGREIDIISDAQLKKIIRDIAKSREPEKAKKTRRKKDEVKLPQFLLVPKIDPQIILQMLVSMTELALTEQAILTALDDYQRSLWEDEDDVAVLLLQ